MEMSKVIKILEVKELDVLVSCSCGLHFYMYVPEVQYQCLCGKLYTAHVHILEHMEKQDNFVLSASTIANLYDVEGDEGEE